MCMGACTRRSEALFLYSHSYYSATHSDGSGTAVYMTRDSNNLRARGKCVGFDSPVPGKKFLFAGRGDRVCHECLCMSSMPKGQKMRKKVVKSVVEGGNPMRNASNTSRPPLPQDLDLDTQQVCNSSNVFSVILITIHLVCNNFL